ncbi:hypothetical protein IQ24_02331 [Paracoccus sulfuroxidans]|uniref:Uncharacterized protein n=2 Tax=Paracoccus sulfuroxidans TaxID=384678 RepID=A0A562NM95_9RHOB|nr:DUF6634 family protein [Paracoccus sulfuroxidans]TWI33190.1 hypothetical protein IQ24_02331 [Paracoccus sulfuroxidans]
MTSSRLIAIDRAAKWARTVSRWYRLGRPFQVVERDLIEASNRSGLIIHSAAFDFGPFIPINDPKKLDRLLADYIRLIGKIGLDQRSQTGRIDI